MSVFFRTGISVALGLNIAIMNDGIFLWFQLTKSLRNLMGFTQNNPAEIMLRCQQEHYQYNRDDLIHILYLMYIPQIADDSISCKNIK